MGTHKQIKATQMNTQNKNLAKYTKTLGPTGLYELHGPGPGKLPMYKLNARDHFNCSPLLFS